MQIVTSLWFCVMQMGQVEGGFWRQARPPSPLVVPLLDALEPLEPLELVDPLELPDPPLLPELVELPNPEPPELPEVVEPALELLELPPLDPVPVSSPPAGLPLLLDPPLPP